MWRAKKMSRKSSLAEISSLSKPNNKKYQTESNNKSAISKYTTRIASGNTSFTSVLHQLSKT